MIQSYKQNPQLAADYDTIIIGSGMSSLTTAAIMAKEGKKVLILERHYTAGGFTHVFKRPGYEWDVGIHYVGEMGKKSSFSRKLSDYITDEQLAWADMGDVYDRVVVGDKIYDFPKGKGNLINELKSSFPNDSEAIEKYFLLVDQAVKANRGFFMDKGMPMFLSRVFGRLLRRRFLKYSRKTTLEVLREVTDNPELIKVLTAQYGDYGLPPAESSFIMHAILVKHYFSGGYFPVGGSSQIALTIDKVIEAAGGTIIINAEVEQVIVKAGRATGVHLSDGREIMANAIISSTGVHNTVSKLLPQDLAYTKSLANQMSRIKPSAAHSCLYVGLNGSPEELNLPKANYWIYPEEGSHEDNLARYKEDINAELPLVYISFPAAKDPDWQNRYPGKSTIDIITLMPYEVFAPWENTEWKKRGEDYEELKEKIAQRLLAKLYELEPQTKGKVDCYELSTPLTTKNFVNYERGEIYGLEHSPERFDNKLLRPHTGIKNFYLTGQDISTAGVVGAMAAGLLTASAVLKKNLIKKILA
jgi:all-trans-retinol 13,14-reductase